MRIMDRAEYVICYKYKILQYFNPVVLYFIVVSFHLYQKRADRSLNVATIAKQIPQETESFNIVCSHIFLLHAKKKSYEYLSSYMELCASYLSQKQFLITLAQQVKLPKVKPVFLMSGLMFCLLCLKNSPNSVSFSHLLIFHTKYLIT